MWIIPKLYYVLAFLTDKDYHENNRYVHVHGTKPYRKHCVRGKSCI